MRFHRLEVTAFGPFPDTVEVDFDELNEAGIFLLTGPTGAGKSSLLDAICFALYGVVPGARGVRTLRSQHVGTTRAPRVVLELTLDGRRFRVERSPEWVRPKKKGEGQTREHASARLLELTGGQERLVSARIQEVGHELDELLGMKSEQFLQVVMLPQGEFQRFLRADSNERQEVLERLFRTQRFARIEDWFKDHARSLATRSASGEADVRRLLETIAHRGGLALPDTLTGTALATTPSDEASAWSHDVLAAAALADAGCAAALEGARAALEEAEGRAREAVRVRAVHRRARDARRVLDGLDADEPAARAAGRLLEAHERARVVGPLLTLVDRAERALDTATDAERVALDALLDLPPDLRPEPSPASCAAIHARVTERLGELRALAARAEDLARARDDLARVERDLARLRHELEGLHDRAAGLPQRRATLEADLTRTRLSAAGLAAGSRMLAEARARLAAARALPAARAQLQQRREASLLAREDAVAARGHHLDLVARRLAGMAAELAGGLVEGEACQVCGSTAHPQPAEAAVDAVSRDDQAEAEAGSEAAARRAEEAAGLAHDAERRTLELERTAEGRSIAEATEEVAAAESSLALAEAAAAQEQDLAAALGLLDAEADELADRLRRTESAVGALAARQQAGTRQVEALSEEVDRALPATIAQHEDAARLALAAADALSTALTARAQADEARSGALETARSAGFDDLADARAALMAKSAATHLREQVTARASARARAVSVLEDPEVAALEGTPDPDAPAAEKAVAAARAEADRLAGEARLLADRALTLRVLHDELEHALVAWGPAREEHLRAESLAQLVRGTGGDNQLQMKLSSYVLSTRLDQVLDAANERLTHLREQRYTLRRTARAARRNAQAGLGLEILDDWTGEERDPATLSGGETFVISLALALGLADVVAHESGGLRVDTLFVDEGFGMLDADTLDDVMDRIDALRAGGRTVGVVSHVAELRNRIPTQVHVRKGRHGSTVEVRTLVG